jgi:indole-3-glycerol phosphate synthase
MSLLSEILATKRSEVGIAQRQEPLEELKVRAQSAPPVRNFVGALRDAAEGSGIGLIAESKKASPSKGILRDPYDAKSLACTYQSAGATCVSVLTDKPYFQGSLNDLITVRSAIDIPVLRKDFVIDAYQIWEARAAGADAILLIAAALPLDLLQELSEVATGLGMAALVEVHNREELDLALQTSSPLIGVNNRDLHTFRTTLQTTIDLSAHIPSDRLIVSESGIFTRDDVRRLVDCGVKAVLVGEALVKEHDVAAKVGELLGR